MVRIALALSIAVSALGVIGLFSPDALLAIGRKLASPGGLLVAAAVRVAFGAVLILAAPVSRAPRTVRGIGVAIVIAGAITPLFGVERARSILDGWASRGPLPMRVAPAVALALGSSLAYLVAPRRSAG